MAKYVDIYNTFTNKVFYQNLYYKIKSRLACNYSSDKFFCLNSGNCGSKYIVELLRVNNILNCFHEKEPSFDDEGLKYYLDGYMQQVIRQKFFETRKCVFLESSNRLFSMTHIINEVFPNAKYIHLHREGKEAISSIVSKTTYPEIFNSNRLRYSSKLVGSKNISPFQKACHYWNNYNSRIYIDLQHRKHLSLKFDDLIKGNVDHLEKFLEVPLKIKKIDPVNTKKKLKKYKVSGYSYVNWSEEEISAFDRICGKTNSLLGY